VGGSGTKGIRKLGGKLDKTKWGDYHRNVVEILVVGRRGREGDDHGLGCPNCK